MKSLDYLMMGLFAAIFIYLMVNTMAGMTNPDAIFTQNMTAGTNYSVGNTIDSTYGVTLSNATLVCSAGNYSRNATYITLKAGVTCASLGIYNFNYHYQVPMTIYGIDFAFVALLVFLAVVFALVAKLTWRGK